MKLELSIKADYLPDWGAYEGIRELVQNGIDAEVQNKAAFSVRRRDQTMIIENDGATLPHEALLMGHTTKVGRDDLRGKFGEGLKLGVLALIRAGIKIKIRSGSEVWVPSIQRSEKFKADVLVFDIHSGRKALNRVAIEVIGLSDEDWDDMKQCFLFLDKNPKDDRVKTDYGTLLLDDKYTGHLFSQGIFVQKDPDYMYGYDLVDVEIDRDRKMVQKWDLRWRINRIWNQAIAMRPDLLTQFTMLLDNQKGDVEGIDEYGARGFSKEICAKVVEQFTERHGADAIPVTNMGESEELGHLGKKGIVTPGPLRSLLQQAMGTLIETKEALKNEVTKTYSWHDLAVAEQEHLKAAIDLLNAVKVGVSLDDIQVCDFRDPKLQGLFNSDGNRISLSREILADRKTIRKVLVHEVAHRQGTDGTKDHVSRIEDIWSEITEYLLSV